MGSGTGQAEVVHRGLSAYVVSRNDVAVFIHFSPYFEKHSKVFSCSVPTFSRSRNANPALEIRQQSSHVLAAYAFPYQAVCATRRLLQCALYPCRPHAPSPKSWSTETAGQESTTLARR